MSGKTKLDKTYAADTRSSLVIIYQALQDTVIRSFGERIWFMTDCCLSVFGAMLLSDIKNPPGLNLVDAPSTAKTTVLSFFYPGEQDSDFMNELVYKTDSFTPRAFVSHAANVKKEELEKIDLLPRIKNKVMVIPELGPIFAKREEDLMELVGILTRVFDGEGLQTDSGIRGRRGYKGKYLFGWLGATTPLDQKVWRVMGKLGSRLLFLTVPEHAEAEERRARLVRNLTDKQTYNDKVVVCRQAAGEFLETLFRYHGGVQSVEWNRLRKRDSRFTERIVVIADFVAKVRSYVSVWKDKGEYEFSRPVQEEPVRLASLLYNLARGHAILGNRKLLNEDDLKIVYVVGMSSMPDDRREALNHLLETGKAKLKTGDIERKLKVSMPTARKIITTLSILGVCERIPGAGNVADVMELKPEFQVLLGEEYRKLSYRNSDDDIPL